MFVKLAMRGVRKNINKLAAAGKELKAVDITEEKVEIFYKDGTKESGPVGPELDDIKGKLEKYFNATFHRLTTLEGEKGTAFRLIYLDKKGNINELKQVI